MKTLQQLLLGLSDTTLITSIGLQVALLTTSCTTTHYLASLAFSLAVLAFITHTLTLIHLRRHLFQHKHLRNIRLLLMILTAINNLLTGHQDLSTPSLPIACGRYGTYLPTFPTTLAGFFSALNTTSTALLFLLSAILSTTHQHHRLGSSIQLGTTVACFVLATHTALRLHSLHEWPDIALNQHQHDAYTLCATLPLLTLLLPAINAASTFTTETSRCNELELGPDLEACAMPPRGFDDQADAATPLLGKVEADELGVKEIGKVCLPSAVRGAGGRVGSLASGILLHPFRAEERRRWRWAI